MKLRFQMATVVSFLFSSALAHAAPAVRTCDASLLPGCDLLASAPLDARGQLGFGTPRDGGAIFNSQAYWASRDSRDAKVRKAVATAQAALMKASPQRETIAYGVADSVRKKAIDFLKLRSPDSAERQILIDRLNSVTIDTTTHPPDTCGLEAVPAGFPNTGYSAHTNTLYLCTPATNITQTQLIQAITHELGHVISPCMAQSKQYSVDKDQLYRGPLVECSSDLFYDHEGNQTGPSDSVAMLMSYQPSTLNERQLDISLQKLSQCGILKEIPKSSVPISQVFEETKVCLLKKTSSSLQSSDAFRLAIASGQSPKKARARLQAAGDDVCAADFEEAFADRFSSSLLGQIANDRGWSSTDLEIATLDKAGFACYEQSHGRVQAGQYEMASARIRNLMSDSQSASKLHCVVPKGSPDCPLKFSAKVQTQTNGATPAKPAGSRK